MSHSPRSFKIFFSTPIDVKDDFEEKLEACHTNITNLLMNASSERERHDILTNQISKGNQEHDDTCQGLFAIILVDRLACQKATQDLMMVNRDSLNSVLSRLNMILLDKYSKLDDGPRMQVLWFLNELVKINILGSDGLCMSLMKQIIGGDISHKNIWLAESLLNILANNRAWLEKSPVLVQLAVYNYLRFIQDHFHPSLEALRKKEVNFCVTMLREKWNECKLIGRDLVRLLMAVARIPEFERFWEDVLNKPQALSPSFSGFPSLVQMRTSRRFLVSRLTPDMETKIGFLLMKVKFGQQKRYQDWFQRQYLSTAESQSLRSDIIRYICGCVHPSNDILCSDVIPRWAVIGWLLSTCTSRVASSYSHLALFWDWLFYSPDKNSVMDIEPGILVMYHSLKNHPVITSTLLDFLCRIIEQFHPPMTGQLRFGVNLAFKTILEKRVLQSLGSFFDHTRVDPELLTLMRRTFPEFSPEGKNVAPPLPPDTGPPPPPPAGGNDIIGEEPMVIEDDPEEEDGKTQGENSGNDTESSQDNLAIFSDEDEVDTNGKPDFTYAWRDSPEREPRDITGDVKKLDETLQDLVTQMQNASDIEEKCERVEDIVDHLLSLDEFDSELCTPLASCLVELFSDNFGRSILNEEVSDEYLEGCVEQPLYLIFRKLCQGREEDDSFSVLLTLLAEMYTMQPRLGYHLLFYLAVRKQTMKENNWFVYESFAQSTQMEEAYNCLMMDMKHCQDDDINMLIFLVPHIYKNFSEHCIGNDELLNIIVAVLDSQQLHHLQCLVMLGELVMMKKDTVFNVLSKSLEWETFEQYSTWQLFAMHEISVEVALPLVPNLSDDKHPEALSMLLLALKDKKPTLEMVRHVTSRHRKDGDHFTVSLLRHWALSHESDTAEHMSTLLNKSKTRNAPPRKGLRQSVRSSQTGLLPPTQPTTFQILGHLEDFRKIGLPKNCAFFSQDPIIASLTNVQQHCDDSDKVKFSELFSLVEDSDDEIKEVKEIRSARKRTKSTASSRSNSIMPSSRAKTPIKVDYDSGSNSSSDDEPLKRKTKRPRISKSSELSDSD